MEWAPTYIRALHDYWTGLDQGNVPDRSQFNIDDLRDLLPYLLVCDFEFDPFRVRFRLSGTKIDEMTGMNLTGHYLDEFAQGAYAKSITEMMGYYEEASRTGRPRIWTYPWAGDNPRAKVIWVGLFPLKVDGKICQCVSIEDYGELDNAQDLLRRDQSVTDWASLSKRY